MSKLSLNRVISAATLIASFLFSQSIDEAIKLFNTFQFDKAKAMFEELARNENNPRIAEIYYYLARLNVNPDTASYYYQLIYKKYPQSRYADVAYLEDAKIAIGREEFKKALEILNELKENYPNSELKEEILFWSGIAYIETGNKEAGYKTLQELINGYPKSIWANRARNLLPTTEPAKEYYTVQVGSYRNKLNAEKAMEDLKSRGFDAWIVEADVMGKIYYRVWVGRFDTMEQAKSLATRLDSIGIKGNVVKGY
jgi:TolA-binding protein|uniref:Tetratricopeptide repeat protein n=1 Tax=candidate division WOR-3 bacterium TaxID=2052148 RepID=A0A7V3RI64_UNCW3